MYYERLIGNRGTSVPVPVVPGSSLLELCSLARQERGWGEGTKKDMSIKDWFKGSCSKAGALNRSWTIGADRSAY